MYGIYAPLIHSMYRQIWQSHGVFGKVVTVGGSRSLWTKAFLTVLSRRYRSKAVSLTVRLGHVQIGERSTPNRGLERLGPVD